MQGITAKELIAPNKNTETNPFFEFNLSQKLKTGNFNLILPHKERPKNKKIKLKKKYVKGFINTLLNNIPNKAEIIPKVVFTKAIPKTKTKVIKKFRFLVETDAAPIIPIVTGING